MREASDEMMVKSEHDIEIVRKPRSDSRTSEKYSTK
jgi:hypothetical protein